jgi:excisionase family DNA binding protein
MMVTLTTDEKDLGPWLVLQDGEWFFEEQQMSQDQGQQQRQKGPGEVEEPFQLPNKTVLRKAEREEVLRWVKAREMCLDVEEAAGILNLVKETIYRMVDRGDLGRVQGTRHVKIPLQHVLNLARGLDKDGKEPKPKR